MARKNTKEYFRKALLFTAMQVGLGSVEFIPITFIGLLGFLSSLWLMVKQELLVLIPLYALRLIPMWLEYALVRICDRVNIEIWSFLYVAPSGELHSNAASAVNAHTFLTIGLLLTLARKSGN